MKKRIYCVLGLLLLVSCNGDLPIAIIHYQVIGLCTTAQLPDGQVSAPPSNSIILIQIKNVDNSKNAIDWNFDPRLISVRSDVSNNLGTNSPSIPIKADKNVPINLPIGIIIDTDAGFLTYNYQVSYELVPPAPGTISVDDAPLPKDGQHPFDPDCNKLLG